MASIQDLYNKSEFAKLADKGKDKTPISADNQNKLHKDFHNQYYQIHEINYLYQDIMYFLIYFVTL